jgi:plasmid replication initiation protein
MQENNLIVKEPEELVLMRGDFSESALKLSAYLIANLKKDKVIYKINVKDYLEKFDKKIGDYNYLYNVTQELSQKQFKMEDRFNKKFAIFNFIASANYADGVLEIEFSHRLLGYLLEIKDKYLRYNIINIMSLSSKYVIRLYKILKDAFEKKSRYGNKVELELSIKELREKLEIPRSYQYSSHIKQRILDKAKKEFEKHTDVLFDYDELKTGRKVTHLKFIINPNPKKIKNIEDEDYMDKYFKNFKSFILFLRKQYSGNKKFFGVGASPDKNGFYWYGLDEKGYLYASYNSNIVDFDFIESEKKYHNFYKLAKNSEMYRELLKSGINLLELKKENETLFNELIAEFAEILK